MGASVWRVGRTAEDRLMYRRSHQGVIQLLRKTMGDGDVCQNSQKKVMKVYASMLLALRGGEWVSIFQEKSVT